MNQVILKFKDKMQVKYLNDIIYFGLYNNIQSITLKDFIVKLEINFNDILNNNPKDITWSHVSVGRIELKFSGNASMFIHRTMINKIVFTYSSIDDASVVYYNLRDFIKDLNIPTEHIQKAYLEFL